MGSCAFLYVAVDLPPIDIRIYKDITNSEMNDCIEFIKARLLKEEKNV